MFHEAHLPGRIRGLVVNDSKLGGLGVRLHVGAFPAERDVSGPFVLGILGGVLFLAGVWPFEEDNVAVSVDEVDPEALFALVDDCDHVGGNGSHD